MQFSFVFTSCLTGMYYPYHHAAVIVVLSCTGKSLLEHSVHNQCLVLCCIVNPLSAVLGIAHNQIGRQLVVRLRNAFLSHVHHPFTIVVPVESVSCGLVCKAAAPTGCLGCEALEFVIQIHVRRPAHQGVIPISVRSVCTICVVLFHRNRRRISLVLDEARLSLGTFFVRTIPSLVMHGVCGVLGIEFRQELHHGFVDRRGGGSDVSSHCIVLTKLFLFQSKSQRR
mmetsp:Transcript_16468/g.37707  ORF Transcript_16468/g.37707 Transcript_16468/m.37707 type:complete len:226 (-) Transcript_16468:66-743(-)